METKQKDFIPTLRITSLSQLSEKARSPIDRGNNSFADRMAAILAQFAVAGISLERPHLNSSSTDVYHALG